MSGKARKNARHIYSNCRPQLNHAGRPDRFPGHPANVYVRADLLTDAVHRFFATRLLGPDRHVHLLADLESGGPVQTPDSRTAQRDALRRAVTDIDQREERLLRALETQDDPDGLLTDRVRTRLAELQRQRRALDDQMRELDALPEPEAPQDPSLLDQLPC